LGGILKRILRVFFFFLLIGGLRAQDFPPASESPVPATVVLPSGSIPWPIWFKKNVLIKDKKQYVYMFFNIQDFKKSFEGKDKNAMLASAASHLVADLYPKTATAKLIKMDMVFIKERDEYGLPKWDTLERVAHLECLKSSVLRSGKPRNSFTEKEIKKAFLKFQLF